FVTPLLQQSPFLLFDRIPVDELDLPETSDIVRKVRNCGGISFSDKRDQLMTKEITGILVLVVGAILDPGQVPFLCKTGDFCASREKQRPHDDALPGKHGA